jgi:lipid-A-disaccharide synthase
MSEEAPRAEGAAAGTPAELRLFVVAGEHSGDALGGKLMAALNARHGPRLRYAGVGGEAMASQGLTSLFPLSNVAVMSPVSILARLPRLVRRVRETVAAAVAADPHAVVIIDSPEFTHPIAKRIRRKRPDIPIVDYVSPSVWAWRPGRASRMRRYVDHVLALLPFEPEAHDRLGGPPCSYVGHPLIERLDWMRDLDPAPLADRLALDPARPVLVVLPGSRASEVARLMQPFGETVARLAASGSAPQVIIPAVDSVRPLIEARLADWPLRPHLVSGEEDRIRAFKLARAALAASGTVTLELALTATPAVVAYRVDALAARLRFLLRVPSVVLANLVLGENVYPEYLQEDCTPDRLAAAVAPLLRDTPARERQLAALRRVPDLMRLPSGSPSEAAAAIVTRLVGSVRSRQPGERLGAAEET